jgi:hypothetical protein
LTQTRSLKVGWPLLPCRIAYVLRLMPMVPSSSMMPAQ